MPLICEALTFVEMPPLSRELITFVLAILSQETVYIANYPSNCIGRKVPSYKKCESYQPQQSQLLIFILGPLRMFAHNCVVRSCYATCLEIYI
jgi:hypothetical protein